MSYLIEITLDYSDYYLQTDNLEEALVLLNGLRKLQKGRRDYPDKRVLIKTDLHPELTVLSDKYELILENSEEQE